MRRGLLLPTVVAVAAAVACGWASLAGYAWTDYELANEAPLRALVHGDIGAFLAVAPVEGPSLLMRAPFALIAWIWGAGDTAIYRMVALPGLLAGVLLGIVLWALRDRLQPRARWSLIVVVLAAANPLMFRALEIGHPEEMIGAALCVGAVLAALWQRPWVAAVLLGLALANKAWAVLAIGPVLLALDRHHWRVLAVACGIPVVIVAPFLLNEGASRGLLSAGKTDLIFQPWQIWWFLGEHGNEPRGMLGELKLDYRGAPVWVATFTHPLIAALVVPATLWWRRCHGRLVSADVLLLLALLFLARCVLDPANNAYYHLPFLMALLAWEALERHQPPLFSLVAVALVWATVEWLPGHASPDAQALAYLLWALPALAILAYQTFHVKSRRGVEAPAPAKPRASLGAVAAPR